MIENNDLTALVQEERHPIFFLIGSRRSGSSWLYTIISESKIIAKPHPTHIFKSFTPILEKFGDLFQEDNMRAIVDHVCEFVEKNPVPWVDVNKERIIFDREQVFQCCRSVRTKHFGVKSRISYGLFALFSFGCFGLVMQVAS